MTNRDDREPEISYLNRRVRLIRGSEYSRTYNVINPENPILYWAITQDGGIFGDTVRQRAYTGRNINTILVFWLIPNPSFLFSFRARSAGALLIGTEFFGEWGGFREIFNNSVRSEEGDGAIQLPIIADGGPTSNSFSIEVSGSVREQFILDNEIK